MERLSHPPLIAHLREQHGVYNGLYIDHELTYGRLNSRSLQQWIVRDIEPAVAAITQNRTERLPVVFKAFYRELLRLAGSGLLFSHEGEYRALWQVCAKVPGIISLSPGPVLSSLHAALQSVRRFRPAMTLRWLSLMETTVAACHSFDELLNCGRMNAWFCGLAHLRQKCSERFPKLPDGLKETLQTNLPLQQPLERLFINHWFNKSGPVFIEAPGGFTGLSGAFINPPLLREAGPYVVAADEETSHLVFADEFGRVLLPAGETRSTANGTLSALQTFREKFGRNLVQYDDVSSCVVKNNTLFLTRRSSHYIYIYGWSNEN